MNLMQNRNKDDKNILRGDQIDEYSIKEEEHVSKGIEV